MNAPGLLGVFLEAYLSPLSELMTQPDVTDIYANRPGELWVERQTGQIDFHAVPALDEQTILRLARQVAALTHQAINREHPLLSARLPDGSRIQIIVPPATRGPPAFAIRKHVASNLKLRDYVASGAFERTQTSDALSSRQRTCTRVDAHLAAGDHARALSEAVQGKLNILISGGTSTGKTTFLNALLDEVPASERLIFIEDTPELSISHENALGLVAARSEIGEASVTANDLVAACLRLRPDRILLGELRGNEAFAFLRAVNTGHPGSMTTIHADSVSGAFEQLALLVLQSGTTLGRADVLHYAYATIGLVVQLGRNQGSRVVSEIRTIPTA